MAKKSFTQASPEAYLELKNGVIDLVAQSVSNANVLVKNNPGVYEIVGEIGRQNIFHMGFKKGRNRAY